MNNEEKILAMLAEIKTTQEKQGELLEKQGEMLEKHSGMLMQMQTDITAIKVRLDYDVDKRLKAVVEGQEAIEQRLDTVEVELGGVKELAERTADKVDVIHAVVARHGAAISELKQAN